MFSYIFHFSRWNPACLSIHSERSNNARERIGDQLSERWKTVLKMAEVSSDVYANTVERNETNDICDRVVTVIREKKKRSRIVNRVARVISVTLHFHIICTLPAFYPRYILYICYYIRKKYVYTGCSWYIRVGNNREFDLKNRLHVWDGNKIPLPSCHLRFSLVKFSSCSDYLFSVELFSRYGISFLELE